MPTLIQKQRELFDKEFSIHSFYEDRRFSKTVREELKSFLNTCLIEHYEEDIRELPEGKVLAEEEWVFQGYGICSGYLLDDEAKPPGRLALDGTCLSSGGISSRAAGVELQPSSCG